MSGRGGSVLGIGVDMTDVSRFRGMDRSSGAVRHFLSAAEMDEVFSRDEPAQTLAGRFAAKEAVIKAATAAFPGRRVFYLDVVIGHNASGAPEARMLDLDAGNYQILLSISHTEEHAIAFAVVVRNDDEHG